MTVSRVALLCVGSTLAMAVGLAPALGRAAAQAPVDAIFVVDNSGSMRRNDPAFITRRVVADFAGALPADSRLGMVVFDADARLAEPLNAAADDASRQRLARRLSAVDFSGQWTNSPAGIERALYELRTRGRPEARQVVVFLTDGLIDTGDAAADQAAGRWLRETLAEAAAKADVRIFGIAFTDSADVELIQTLALRTGGEYFRATRAEDIAGVVAEIIEVVVRPDEPAATPAVATPEPARTAPAARAVSAPAPRVDSAPREGEKRSLAIVVLLVALAGFAGVAAVVRSRRAPEPSHDSGRQPAETRTASPMPAASLFDVGNVGEAGTLPFPIVCDRVAIGRDVNGDISIARDTISSLHATIEFRNGLFHLEDQRSTNGTRLNRRPLAAHQPVALKSGDRIDFADFEYRFLLPDREPSGQTVVLGGSSLPASGPEPQTELVPALPGAPGSGAVVADDDLFEQCLTRHLDRICALGPAYERFVHAHFSAPAVRDLTTNAARLMKAVRSEHHGRTESYVGDGVVYLLSVLPEAMEQAADWFGKQCGGYGALLRDTLDTDPFARGNCDTLCAVTYGRAGGEGDAWVSVTIVPADHSIEHIDIMSVELLTQEERRTLALGFDDAGRVL